MLQLNQSHTTRIDSSDLNTANPSAKLNTTSKHKSADTTIINKLMTRNKPVSANLSDHLANTNLTKKTVNIQVDTNSYDTVMYADCDNVGIGLSTSQGDRTTV